MCSSFAICSICSVSEWKNAPTNHAKFAAYNVFIPIMDKRYDRTAKFIYALCVDIGKWLTHVCYQEHENADHNDINFDQRTNIHFARLRSELKSKCDTNEVRCWVGVHFIKKKAMHDTSHYLLCKDSYTPPPFSLIEKIVYWIMFRWLQQLFSTTPWRRLQRSGMYLNWQLLKGNHCRLIMTETIKIWSSVWSSVLFYLFFCLIMFCIVGCKGTILIV